MGEKDGERGGRDHLMVVFQYAHYRAYCLKTALLFTVSKQAFGTLLLVPPTQLRYFP